MLTEGYVTQAEQAGSTFTRGEGELKARKEETDYPVYRALETRKKGTVLFTVNEDTKWGEG